MAAEKSDNTSIVQLTEERKNRLISDLQEFFRTDFDEDLSTFRAEFLLRFMLQNLGPPVYNQAVQDARAFLNERIEDMDATLFKKDPK